MAVCVRNIGAERERGMVVQYLEDSQYMMSEKHRVRTHVTISSLEWVVVILQPPKTIRELKTLSTLIREIFIRHHLPARAASNVMSNRPQHGSAAMQDLEFGSWVCI